MTDTLLKFDSFHDDTTDGFDYAGNLDSLTITAGFLAGSSQGRGVFSFHDGNLLINDGSILSGASTGVEFDGNNGSILNNDGHSIVGKSSGIELYGNIANVTNHGAVMGATAFGVLMGGSSDHVVLNSDGEIFGRFAGVGACSGFAGGAINNTGAGVIRSDHHGIYVATAPGQTTFITNGLHATIAGVDDSIHASQGAISLTNLGTLVGNVQCLQTENDTVINRGKIVGLVDLGQGDDVYNGKGGGIVTGGIHGGAGVDKLIAGAARETFFGDADADTFIFKSVQDSRATAKRDAVLDFSQGDKIDIHAIDADVTHPGHQAFTFIGTDTFAHFHSLHPGVVGMVRFSTATHRLQGNVNGDFVHADFEVGLPSLTALHASDLILA